ncbi:MAG: hypothetical protein K1Y02_22455 [Candidatus Hydrogenedentes bacterium]|nr:hypothetical protein [Candidatus Hydrogenedentota bacterium]
MRLAIGISILAAQIVMIGAARFGPMRYFCWAPYDSQNEYRIAVEIEGRSLSPEEIEKRYRIPAQSVNPRAIQEITDVVAHVEGVYRPGDKAEVQVRYRTNGGEERLWQWPLVSAP